MSLYQQQKTYQKKAGARRLLASATKAIHEELHNHPLVSRLLVPDLKAVEYDACLRINLCFFSQIEDARVALNAFESCCLGASVRTLLSDVKWMEDFVPVDIRPSQPDITISFHADEILGALYVAHGSQFGRQMMAKAVARSLPHAPQTYLSLTSDMARWRKLELLLDGVQADQAAFGQVEKGAHKAFDLFKKIADHYGEKTYLVGTGISP